MKYLTLGLSVVVLLAFSACSSSTSTSTPPDYYKGIDKVGNYWIYQNQVIDTNGVVQSVSYTDSMWVQGSMFVAGKMATVLISYSTQNSKPVYDTTYISRDGNKLFAYLALPSIPLDTTTTLPSSTWVLVSNPDATGSWLVIDTVSTARDVTFSGVALSLSIKMWMNATHHVDTTMKVANGTSYKCSWASVDPLMKGSLTPKGLPFPQAISLSGGSRSQFYSDGIALVAERMEPTTITIGGGLVPPIKNAGSLRTLLRYHIQ